MLHVIFAEGLARPGRLAEFTDGLERLASIVERFPPERVAARTGLPPEAIRALARDFAAAPTAVCYGRVGISTQEFGGLASWLVERAQRRHRQPRPAGRRDVHHAGRRRGRAQRAARVDRAASAGGRSRVRGLPEFGGRAAGGRAGRGDRHPGRRPDPRRSSPSPATRCSPTPNGRRLDRALAGLDFMVSIDLYRNETTRHAHLILPPSFGLERDHYDLVFNALAVRNVARYANARGAAARPGVRDDWRGAARPRAGAAAHGGGARARRTSGLTLRGWPARSARGASSASCACGPRRTSRSRRWSASPHGRRPRSARAAAAGAPLHPRPAHPAGAPSCSSPTSPGSRPIGSRRRRGRACCSSAGARCAATTPGCTTARGS